MSRDRFIRALAASATLLASAVMLSSCGSSSTSSSGSAADPASIAPAGSALYFTVVVRPSGSLKTGAVGAAREITHLSDPFGDLIGALDRAAGAHSSVSYASDIAPWLGTRVGVFLDPAGASAAGASAAPLSQAFAAIADSTDSTKATAFIDKVLRSAAQGQSLQSQSYDGISYDTIGSNGREAGGVVNGFAVLGTVAGVRDVISTAKGGAALSGSSSYQSSSSAVGAPGALAGAFVNPESLTSLVAGSGNPEAQVLSSSIGQAGLHPVALAISATVSSLVLDAGTSVSSAASSSATGAAQALAALPGDAWLGLGLGNLGADISHELGGSTGNAALEQELLGVLDSHLHGLNIQRDILPWLGSAALFVTGASVNTLGGALVIQSTNQAASKAAIPRIGAALSGLPGVVVRAAKIPGADAGLSISPSGSPLVIYILDGNGRFAVAVGAQAAAQALRPTNTLARSAIYHAASNELGAGLQPTLLISIPSIARLVLPHLPPATASKIKPYLNAFTVLASGTEHSASGALTRLVLGLH